MKRCLTASIVRPRVVDAERRLGDISHGGIDGDGEALDIVFALDEMHLAFELAHGALDLGMAGMADQDDDAALVEITLTLMMDLGDERTDRIQHRQAAFLGIELDGA